MSAVDTFLHMFTFWNNQFLSQMFELSLPVAEKVLRPVLVYAALVVFLRAFGKRELAQLNPFDLVVLLSLSNTVQNAIIGDDDSVTGGLIGAFTLLATNYLVIRFLFKHRRLDQFVQGTSTVLIDHGSISKKGLARELMTEVELTSVVHRQGFDSLADIERCVLEPNGTFFIKAKSPPRHVVRHSQLIDRLDAVSRQIEQLRDLLRPQEGRDDARP